MNIAKEEILKILKNAGVAGKLRNITYDTSLRKAGLDSLDMVNTMLALEEKFGIKISDDEAEKLDTVNSITELLNSKVK